MASSSVTASAPGKVLIVGGYLVLQEGIKGYVISTSSRFHACVAWMSSAGSEPSATGVPVVVASPQFHDEWKYVLQLSAPYILSPTEKKTDGSPKRNPYVECAVEVAIAAACGLFGAAMVQAQFADAQAAGKRLVIKVEADNEFYSQRQALQEAGLPVSRESLASLPARNACPRDPATGKAIISKTGLGSSAALVTSLTGAMLGLLGAVPSDLTSTSPSAPSALSFVHSCAQVAHGWAQGKIGSGFDVCSAVYGSISFGRIPPKPLGACMDRAEAVLRGAAGTDGAEQSYLGLAKLLVQLAQASEGKASATGAQDPADEAIISAWRYTADPFGLPPGLALSLADVAGGSETPGMVRIILAWRDKGAARDEEDYAIASVKEAIDTAKAQLFPSGPPAEEASTGQDSVAQAYGTAVGPFLWRLLAAANANVAVCVARLDTLARKLIGSGPEGEAAYFRALRHAVASGIEAKDGLDGTTAEVLSCLRAIRTSFGLSRALLRSMGAAAGVPVEPDVQTALADATLSCSPGVLAAGVPGAGGYDALYAVIIDVDDKDNSNCSKGKADLSPVRRAVEATWLAWPGGGLTPLLLRDGPARGQAGAGIAITAVAW